MVPEYQVGWQTMNVMCDVSHIPYHILHVMLELVVYMSDYSLLFTLTALISSSSQITYTLSSMYMLSVGLTAIMHGFDDQYGSYNVQCTFFASNELPSVFCHNIYLPMNLLYNFSNQV